jgi:hypothetical protein
VITGYPGGRSRLPSRWPFSRSRAQSLPDRPGSLVFWGMATTRPTRRHRLRWVAKWAGGVLLLAVLWYGKRPPSGISVGSSDVFLASNGSRWRILSPAAKFDSSRDMRVIWIKATEFRTHLIGATVPADSNGIELLMTGVFPSPTQEWLMKAGMVSPMERRWIGDLTVRQAWPRGAKGVRPLLPPSEVASLRADLESALVTALPDWPRGRTALSAGYVATVWWPGLLWDLTLLGRVAGVVLVGCAAVRWARRCSWGGLPCVACSYDLSGLPAGAPCPECGEGAVV